jgi:putative ABC transport system substrate-binding protein
MLNRRAFLYGSGAMLAAPPVIAAQQADKVPRVGFLTPSQDPECEKTPQAEAFRQGLRDRGWVPRQTITVDHRCYETVDQGRVIVNDFVDRRVDVIVAGTAGVEAARSATKTIPIVMLHADPVGVGLVASLARPGGNITGLSISPPEMTEKRLQLLKEMIPRLSRVAVFADPTVTPRYREELDTAGRTLRLTLQTFEMRAPEDVASALNALIKKRPNAVMVQTAGTIIVSQRRRIVDWANQHRLPTMFGSGLFVREGGLAGYGADVPDAFRRLATYVDKILKGAKPGDLPVEQPTKFELVINLKTAKALGLTIPPSLLARADQVIE